MKKSKSTEKNKYILESYYYDKKTNQNAISYEPFELEKDQFIGNSILFSMLKPEMRYCIHRILDCQTGTYINSYLHKDEVLIMN
jgi:hypothetical protein